jgi:hypothetical protein
MVVISAGTPLRITQEVFLTCVTDLLANQKETRVRKVDLHVSPTDPIGVGNMWPIEAWCLDTKVSCFCPRNSNKR